jgi:hypothetical protein
MSFLLGFETLTRELERAAVLRVTVRTTLSGAPPGISASNSSVTITAAP